MAKQASKKTATSTVEDKLRALYRLQLIDSQIDKLKTVRGELPLQIEDLEDEIAGLTTRFEKIQGEIEGVENKISDKKNAIKESEALIAKYEEQQNNVRNNREFDSLSKEIEFQTLEIKLAEKRIKEHEFELSNKKEVLQAAEEKLNEKKKDLEIKQSELDGIVSETKKDEEKLIKESTKAEKAIEERLLKAYKRIRGKVANGLAVVPVERHSAGGSYIQIPPQRILDIGARKKVIVDEHSGRILVDNELAAEEAENLSKLLS